jgi:GNAT superfamily N-acetyltransferase
MDIQVLPVRNNRQKKDFVNLPFQIYKDNPYWVPPLIRDEKKVMDPGHNPALGFCDAEFWLAYRDGKPVGRIAAIINHRYNEKTGEKNGRFFKLEFFDDAGVFKALMDTAAQWLKERGMKKVHGPLGFTNLDTQGLLIEGFDYIPSVASVYHLPYYHQYIEQYGFKKEIDWLEFRLHIGKAAVEKANRGAALLRKRFGFELVRFKKTKELLPYVDDLFNVLNKAFEQLPYVVPFDKAMREMYTRKYLKSINPRYVFFVKKDGKMIGFMLTVPSCSEAMQKAKGKLFPFGFYYLMKAMKHPQVIDFFLSGVLPEYEKQGAAVMLYAAVQNQMLEDGIDTIETTGIFETNRNAISNWKNFEHIQHKRRRCFVKEL